MNNLPKQKGMSYCILFLYSVMLLVQSVRCICLTGAQIARELQSSFHHLDLLKKSALVLYSCISQSVS